MTLTRWKLMAGVLGLSLCGLAALAEPACRTVGYAQRKPDDLPKPADTGAKPLLPPPVEVTPPTPAPLPVPPPAVLPKADAPPAKTEVPPPGPLPLPKPEMAPSPEAVKPLPLPKVADGGLDEKAFTEMAKQSLKLPDLPKLDAPKKGDTKPLTLPLPAPDTKPVAPVAEPPAPKLDMAPLPVPASGGWSTGHKLDNGQVIINSAPKVEPFAPVPQPVKAEVPAIPPQHPSGVNPAPSQLTPRAVETAPTPVSATVPAERKLKVQLHLGGGKPWFEIRDGEETVLKVVSDTVEVKAHAESGTAANVLKASGGVSFRTLGGNGTCDDLQVIPGTGEVVVSGRVVVASTWGKTEATATAEKMTFRLGGDKK